MKKKLLDLPFIGAAVGSSAADNDCQHGPATLQHSSILENLIAHHIKPHWLATVKEPLAIDNQIERVATFSQQLAVIIRDIIKSKQQFITIGGDHSCAIGTWSGAKASLAANEDLGLIWIDAHMDAHTFDTSLTKNIHGMPVAALLGHGETSLTNILSASPKIKPEHLCLIGIRSYEKAEAQLLKQLGVKVFFMEDIKKLGLKNVMQQAYTIVTQNTQAFGISIDLDGVDPKDAPGTGMHEADGIKAQDLCEALQLLKPDKHLLGLEIAEFSPKYDVEQRTQQLIIDLIINTFTYGT